MPDQFEQYYKYLKANGADVAPDFNSFKNTLSDYNNASKYYSYLKENQFDVPETYDSFADTFGLKKKVGGAESSPTGLPLQGFSQKQIDLLKKGVEKPVSVPSQKKESKLVIPTNLPKQEALAYENELKLNDVAVNTLTDIYKKKGLKFDPSKPAAKKQIQEYVDKSINGDLTKVTGKDGKEYLVRSQGFFESAGDSFVRSLKDPIESTEINFTNSPEELANLLDEKIRREPNVPKEAPSAFSGYLGGLAGGLPKLAAIAAIPYVGQTAMVGEMYYNALANQRRELYQRGLEEGMDRVSAAKKAMEVAPVSAIPDALVAAVMARGVGGKAGGSIIPNAAKESFIKAAGNALKSVGVVSATGGFTGYERSKIQQRAGYKVTDAEAIENGFREAGDYAIMDAAFKVAHIGPKYLSSAAKNVLSTVPKEVLNVIAEKYPDGKRTLDEIPKFVETKAKVQDFVPEEKLASVTGLTEKTDNIKSEIKDLEEKKKAVTPAIAKEIDLEIADKNKEVDFYDNQIKKVIKSKDETGILEEVDDVTGFKVEEGIVPAEVKKPSVEQQAKESIEGNLVTFTYKSEAEVPEVFKERISSSGENTLPDGTIEKFVRVTVPKSLAEYELSKIEKPKTAKEEISVYHGGSIKDLATTEGGLFVSADKGQAESYAKGNKGKVQEFKLNKNDISNENNVREVINELGLKSKEEGWDLNDLMLHEIIDLRFETSLSEGDLNKLFKELDRRGYKAIEMMATDVSGKQRNVNDILILNPKETLKEVKPTEVKVTEVKKPSKELIEGEEIAFKTPEGSKVTGEKVEVPGYEDMDLVLVRDGFENRIYELSSGLEIGGTQEAFSKEAAIESLRKQLEERKITSEKIHNVIFKGERVKQINPSKKFESYAENRTAREKSDYESLPLKFTPKEIAELQELKKKAVEYGIDKKVKEIEDAISSRAKEGTFKPNTEYFEKILQTEIDKKIKKESEQNKVPYPKEYIKESPKVTEDYLKNMVNSGFKVDKFSKIPSDVKKMMIDGLQLSRDFLNKYGYHPYEQSDNFFTKLLYFMNSIGARENKEARAIEARKELTSALDNLRKVHEKEFGKKEIKPKEKVELSEKEIQKNENSITKDYYKTFPIGKTGKIKDGSIIVNTDIKNGNSVFRIEFKKQGKVTASPQTVSEIKKWAESKGLEFTGTTKEELRETIDFKLPFGKKEAAPVEERITVTEKPKEEKIFAQKDLDRAEAKRIHSRVAEMEPPSDAEQVALRYLAEGGKVSQDAINEVSGTTKRASLNTGRRELKTAEAKARDYAGGTESLDDLAHRLWEASGQKISERDIKDALMSEIGNNNTRLDASKAYLERYNAEYKIEQEEMRVAEQYAEQYLEEQERLEKELRKPLDEQIEGEASEEHINNLINQYEAEFKAENQQLRTEGEGEVSKEVSKGKVIEKAPEAELAKDYKETVAKVSKKAKENAKKDFVERNFDSIVEKLKIQIKCPT